MAVVPCILNFVYQCKSEMILVYYLGFRFGFTSSRLGNLFVRYLRIFLRLHPSIYLTPYVLQDPEAFAQNHGSEAYERLNEAWLKMDGLRNQLASANYAPDPAIML